MGITAYNNIGPKGTDEAFNNLRASEKFGMLKNKFTDEIINKLEEMKKNEEECRNGKKDRVDWREMSDDEWDKLVDNIDDYLDDYKNEIKYRKQIQDEAAVKMASKAPAQFKSLAMSQAILMASADGFTPDVSAANVYDTPNSAYLEPYGLAKTWSL